MPPPGTRKIAKSRRRAISKLMIPSSFTSNSNTADKASPNGNSYVATKGGSSPSSSTTKAISSTKSSTSAVQSQSSNTVAGAGRDPPMPSTSKKDVRELPYYSSFMTTAGSGWRCDMMWSAKRSETSRERKASVIDYRKFKCAVCQCPSTGCCSACGKVFYCGKTHQKKDWNDGHKLVCYPFEDMLPEELEGQVGPLGNGQYLKASRDLHPMEKIYEDHLIMSERTWFL